MWWIVWKDIAASWRIWPWKRPAFSPLFSVDFFPFFIRKTAGCYFESVVVSDMVYFHTYLGKWSNLTNWYFSNGWNHQLGINFGIGYSCVIIVKSPYLQMFSQGSKQNTSRFLCCSVLFSNIPERCCFIVFCRWLMNSKHNSKNQHQLLLFFLCRRHVTSVAFLDISNWRTKHSTGSPKTRCPSMVLFPTKDMSFLCSSLFTSTFSGGCWFF